MRIVRATVIVADYLRDHVCPLLIGMDAHRIGIAAYGQANGETVVDQVAGYVDCGYQEVQVQGAVPGVASTYGVATRGSPGRRNHPPLVMRPARHPRRAAHRDPSGHHPSATTEQGAERHEHE